MLFLLIQPCNKRQHVIRITALITMIFFFVLPFFYQPKESKAFFLPFLNLWLISFSWLLGCCCLPPPSQLFTRRFRTEANSFAFLLYNQKWQNFANVVIFPSQ